MTVGARSARTNCKSPDPSMEVKEGDQRRFLLLPYTSPSVNQEKRA